MNNLYADIGFNSMNKDGETLCGDHVDVVMQEENSTVIVLSDGLGSGVQASILSTLTCKIISTMMADGLDIEDCVETIAKTLPVCKEAGVAYSTFTIIRLVDNIEAEIIQYGNPRVILLRDGKNHELPGVTINIGGKNIYRSSIALHENDIFIAVSDGAVGGQKKEAGTVKWNRDELILYMETFYDVGFTAKTLTTILLDHCYALSDGQLQDDTTVCTVRIRKRNPINLAIGPPSDRDDCAKMMSLFFSKEGKHIVCGGTTSAIAAKFLNKNLVYNKDPTNSDIPKLAEIDGVDLVTEGIITINQVLEYAKNHLNNDESYAEWSYQKDGASQIACLLFEEATDINFFVGQAVNPAHQDMDSPIAFSVKMHLVEQLANCLKQMGKHIRVSYF